VTRLGRAACEGYLAGGVLPIVKHLPGHGRALVDSHVDLPVVTADRATLAADFAPFRALAGMPWAMTAHVVYTALDPARPATLSPTVIAGVIRGEIGFDGVLVSDDLCMGALTGGPDERAAGALAAGCDVALHCNGRMREMVRVAAAVPPLSEAALARLARAESLRRNGADGGPADSAALRSRVAALLAAA
jgi:beta-N-acetylhexosaminidase